MLTKRKVIILFILFGCASNPSKINYSSARGKTVTKEVLASAIPGIRYCYKYGLSTNKTITLKTAFTINEVGNVASIRIDKNSLDTKTLTCIRQKILLLKFPKPINSKKIDVTQPFNLYPESS